MMDGRSKLDQYCRLQMLDVEKKAWRVQRCVWSGHADGGLCECGKISSVLDFAIGATRDHDHDTSNIIFPASYRGAI